MSAGRCTCGHADAVHDQAGDCSVCAMVGLSARLGIDLTPWQVSLVEAMLVDRARVER